MAKGGQGHHTVNCGHPTQHRMELLRALCIYSSALRYMYSSVLQEHLFAEQFLNHFCSQMNKNIKPREKSNNFIAYQYFKN